MLLRFCEAWAFWHSTDSLPDRWTFFKGMVLPPGPQVRPRAGWGTAAQMFFQLGNIRLCASLERAVKSPAFLPLSSFPAAQQVTYNYYIGRLAVFDEDYVPPPPPPPPPSTFRLLFRTLSLHDRETCFDVVMYHRLRR